jgi:hypothetical protein
MRPYGQEIRDIKMTLENFASAEIVHEGRSSNGDAHMLARSCVYEPLGRHVWVVNLSVGVCSSFSMNDE